jgi:hypothetical protein
MIDWWMHASWPLVRLTLDAKAATVGPSHSWLRWLFRAKVMPWSDIERVVKIRGGVRFYLRGEGGSTSFATLAGSVDPDHILDLVATRGVAIDRDVHRSGWWGGD